MMQRRASSGRVDRPFRRTIATVVAIAAGGVTAASGSSLSAAVAATAAPMRSSTASTVVRATATGGGATISLTAPARVGVGGTVRVRLDISGAPTLAAFQGVLRYDHRALEVSRVVFAPHTAAGGRLRSMQSAALTDRSALAAWSCATRACDPSIAASARPQSARSAVQHVAVIDVEPLARGRVQLRFDGILLAGADGSKITSHRSVSITLNVAAGTRRWNAPAPQSVTTPAPSVRAHADIDGDRTVSLRDAQHLTQAWSHAAESDVSCAPAPAGTDADGDGCLSIADLQTVAAQVTSTATLAVSSQAVVQPAVAAFVVNSNLDGADKAADGVCQTATVGECTLRAAIQEANRATGAATISFNIPGGGVHTIQATNTFPPLNNPNGISINGFTQPGSSANTDPLADNAVYTIEIVGGGASGFDGFYVATSHNEFRGLDMHNFKRDIEFDTTTGSYNVIEGNMFGLLPDGSFQPGFAYVPPSSCIVLQGGASHNQIGAPGNENRNVISGCAHLGIGFYLWGTKYNVIQNNIIGLDPTGTQARGSISHGVDINTGTQWTYVGGANPGEHNVISGNRQHGVEISHNPLTLHNFVTSNFIGTDLTGNLAPAYASNLQTGIHLEGFPNCAGPCPEDAGMSTVVGNVIAGNGKGGVLIDKGVHDSVVSNNLIGMTATGIPAGNGLFGVHIEAGSHRNTIGPGNEIANNGTGIQIRPDGLAPPNPVPSVTNANKITQNSIHDNGMAGMTSLGIDLSPLGAINTAANADPNVNDSIVAPTLASGSPTSVVATTCAGCTVEVFLADRGVGYYGSGKTYLASAVADGSGVANVTLPAGMGGLVVTATTTNAAGSTSEFARNTKVATVSNDQPPIATFTVVCTKLSCSFDATASHDPDGSIVSYTWDFGDGTTGSGVTATHAYVANGTYNVQLGVIDNLGASASLLKPAAAINQLPTAAFTWSCTSLDCSVNASGSHDPDGSIVSYAWDFGDTTSGVGAVVAHHFAAVQAYAVTLTVTDDSGGTGSVVVAVVPSSLGSQGNSVFSVGARFTVNGRYTPIPGDFNGDGKGDIVWYAPGAGTDSIWYSTGTGFHNGPAIVVNGTYKPIQGDFNGDGKGDILWYAPGAVGDTLWYGSTAGFTVGSHLTINGKYKPVVADFNGDGKSDIVWDVPGTLAQTVWYGAATGFTQSHVNLFGPPGILLRGDFNGDGFGDVFFYQAGSAKEHLWNGSPSGPVNVAVPSINGTYTPVSGDFNGDGKTDVFWYAPGSGTDSMWYGSATGIHAGPHDAVNGVYIPISGDFNGDGKSDVFWYAPGTATESVWYGIG